MLEIRTYQELDQIVGVFAAGGYNLLGIIGDPGHAKSRTVRAAVEGSGRKFVWIRNTVTAFHLYQEPYRHRDAELLVIDDVDSFYSDKALVRLLKCLCETEREKTLTWHTDAAKLDREEIPRQFTVAMRVAIISNDLKRLNANVGALEDRGHVFRFVPTAAEVHARAGDWFEDGEIYAFIGRRLGLLNGKLSLRDYLKAAEHKAGGLDWRKMLLASKKIDDDDVILERLLSTPYDTEADRIREFTRTTGRSRSTYFRMKQRMAGAAT